ncbi:MAG: BMP family protein [Anaerolineaceae bacterium]|nr:BMP family protein [Anaerolineaceae bacterium]
MKKTLVMTLAFVMVLALALTACQPQTVVQTVEVEKTVVVEKEVEKTVVVEVEKPAEPMEEAPMVAPGELRIALLLDGPINDQGWNQGAYDGLAAVKTKYLADTAYSESVARADMEAAFTDYAARGYNAIFAHGFEFSDAAEKAAAQFPDTLFVVTHGKSGLSGDNIATIQYEEEQIGFLLGVLAGQMTKSNKIAAIGGYEIPPIAVPFKAFEVGAKEVNPDVNVSILWIDSWTDIAKMKEAANAAIATGTDLVFPIASAASAGGLYAAEESGVWGIGYSGDQYVFAPTVTLSSGIVDTGLSIELVVDEIVNGTFTHKDYWYGVKDNVLRLAPYHNTADKIPQEVKDSVDEWTQKILSGEYEVPIKIDF